MCIPALRPRPPPQRWGIRRPADLLVFVPSDVAVTNLDALASAVSNMETLASGCLGGASDALLQQLGSLALPSLAEEPEEGQEGSTAGGTANGTSAAASASAAATLAASSKRALLARRASQRLSQRLLAHGSQSLRLPTQ